MIRLLLLVIARPAGGLQDEAVIFSIFNGDAYMMQFSRQWVTLAYREHRLSVVATDTTGGRLGFFAESALQTEYNRHTAHKGQRTDEPIITPKPQPSVPPQNSRNAGPDSKIALDCCT